MYLKSIEVQGFKSFANKITFQFHNGITGIVGPNGSGKSNVADAVRWVLGEQSAKQLRGASMQDVIFSGTEMRKPLSSAYVAITLDNSDRKLALDYPEVTVSRRLYRSGESEYMLNGTVCRLRDVHELFFDTGIGKEGYSIIGQGQIEQILSGKPEDRRALFDEAAGIVKFKSRKATAQKKLETEQQNLVRVNDVLSELERQTGPLEKQAEKARIYLNKRESLKTLDVNVFLLENEKTREDLSKAEENLSTAQEELTQVSENLDRKKEEYEQAEHDLEEADRLIEEARGKLTDTGVTRSKLEGEINVLKERIHSAESNEEHMQSREETLGAQIAKQEEERDEALIKKQEADAELSGLEEERNKAKAALEEIQSKEQALEKEIETAQASILEGLTTRATIKSRMSRNETMLEQLQIQRAELNAKLLEAKSEEARQGETIQSLEENFTAIGEEIQKLQDGQASLEEKLGELRDTLASQDQTMRDTQVLYHQEKSKLEALSNMTERYEGYGGAVKTVMEQKDEEKGIIGVVADIIQTDKRYETAMETALGASIQNVVTEDTETAKRLIAFLKKTKAGRVTFLPLTSLSDQNDFKPQEALREKGVLGLASDLVQTTKKSYQRVALSLLGRVLVVDTVDNAIALQAKYKQSLRLVTLEGELLTPGGAISGGAYKNNSNLLGRRREMEELRKKVREYAAQVDDLLNQIEETKKTRNQVRMDIEETKGQIQRKFIEQNTARVNLEQERVKQEKTSSGYGDLATQEQDLDTNLRQIKEEQENISKELTDSEKKEEETNARIQTLQDSLEEQRAQENVCAEKVSARNLEVEKMRQKAEFTNQDLERMEEEIGQHKRELQEVRDGISFGRENVETYKENIEKLKATIEASYQAEKETDENLKAEIEKKEKLTERRKTCFAEREELSAKSNALDKEVYRLTAQKEKLESSMETQINYMWEEYEITLSAAAEMRDAAMTDLSGMKKEIQGLKDEIRKLGDVNVNAIEEYRDVMERYTFMKNQHDDLVAAAETLQGVIADLDTSMRKQFAEKFAQINKEFDHVFKELFGGGTGTLRLVEDEDILEAGIDITAQPPGKKLVNMMQLSGGEKSLTAICLLFAIQNLKPSPFCLLDEIDAALDDTNVGQFAKYLRKLTKNTQFIVITHRRGTMERADRLYGITMQEKGVSVLVSVDLIDKDLTN